VQTKEEAMELPIFDVNFGKFYDSLVTEFPIPDPMQSTSKWELRKVGKEARTFMTGGLHMHIASAMMYKAQQDAMIMNHDVLWSAVGISQYRGGWDRLYHQLSHVGGEKPLFISADVSGWDRDVPPILFEAVRDILFRQLPKNEQNEANYMRSVNLMRMNVFAPVVLEHGEVVLKTKGMGSGAFVTIFWNTLMHMLAGFYAFIKMMGPVAFSMTLLDLFVFLTTTIWMKMVGDDEAGAINTDRYTFFTEKGYREAYADFGFTMKVVDLSTKLEELNFLSSKWVRRHSMWVSCPDRDKVLCQVAYGARKTNIKTNYLRLLSLAQLSYADEELFNLLVSYAAYYKQAYLNDLKIDKEGELTFYEIECCELDENEIRSLHCGKLEAMGPQLEGMKWVEEGAINRELWKRSAPGISQISEQKRCPPESKDIVLHGFSQKAKLLQSTDIISMPRFAKNDVRYRKGGNVSKIAKKAAKKRSEEGAPSDGNACTGKKETK